MSNDQLAKISTADYLPGVYNSSWSGTVNGHLVALTNVAVLRDGGAPARKPNLLIYRDYDGNQKVVANYRGTPEANAYQGDKALLFRVFSEGPVRCMDVVIPNSNPRSAPDSNLIYTRKEEFYQAGFSPSLAK